MLIFVLQTIWLYIKELAGRDLDIVTIGKFLFFFLPKLMPLVLPLTILLSSIMVFGNFAENYEFAAMKSSGISLQRAMRSLSVFIVGLGILTFFFANNVIPWAEFNSYNLRKNIQKLKPAMAIAEGQFNQVGDQMNIKVDKKSGDRGQFLEGITIHKKSSNGKNNSITIRSKTGELKGSEDSEVLQLILLDGNYYDDTPPKKQKDNLKRPFAKSDFTQYTINVDLSQLNDIDLDEKNFSQRYNMLDIKGLHYTIDSLYTEMNLDYKEFSENMHNRSGIVSLNTGVKPKEKDSIYNGKILDLFKTSNAKRILDVAINTASSSEQIIKTKETQLENHSKTANYHIIALQEKLAIGFACIILFFVGAPLGAIIRKGGIGLPMVIAILLFLTYHFIGIFAKNSAKDGTIDPTFAPWIATLIMLPLGVYLTKRATADRGLFEIGNVLNPIKKLLNIKSNAQENNLSTKDFERFKEDKLIGIIKNPENFDFNEDAKYYALNALTNRGKSINSITEKGISIKDSYNNAIKLKENYNDYSKYSLIFYICSLVFFILFLVFRNNKLPSLASMSVQLSVVSVVLLFIYYIAIQFNIKKIEKLLPTRDNSTNSFISLLGLPIYPFMHFFNKKKIENYIKQKCLNSLK